MRGEDTKLFVGGIPHGYRDNDLRNGVSLHLLQVTMSASIRKRDANTLMCRRDRRYKYVLCQPIDCIALGHATPRHRRIDL